MNKIKTVLELGRFKAGDTAWRVIFRPSSVAIASLQEEDLWMTSHHPKTLYERGPFKKYWNKRNKLPKLPAQDFLQFVGLMNCRLAVEEFLICDIGRSNCTGEYLYLNDEAEIMPESYLFDTNIAATSELKRLKRIIENWNE